MKFLSDNDYKQMQDAIANLTTANETLTAENAQLKENNITGVAQDVHDAVVSANETLTAEKATVEANLATAQTDLTQAQETITKMETELDTLRKLPGAVTAQALGANDADASAEKNGPVTKDDASFVENLLAVKSAYLQ